MKINEIKIMAEYYEAISSGKKKFELVKKDQEFEVGDLIKFLVETGTGVYKSYKLFQIVYIMHGEGLQENYCILGIEEMKQFV